MLRLALLYHNEVSIYRKVEISRLHKIELAGVIEGDGGETVVEPETRSPEAVGGTGSYHCRPAYTVTCVRECLQRGWPPGGSCVELASNNAVAASC